NSVGVGLGSGDWLEDDESSESNHEHPDRTRASATTPPWILLLRFTPITLPCPRGINNFHSPFRDASRPKHPPHHDSHPVRIPTPPPRIPLLRFTPSTLPRPRGIPTLHSPFRDPSRPNPPPHHASHPVRIPTRRGTLPTAMTS